MNAEILWTADEAMQATGGTTAQAWSAQGVSIDSRSVAAGDLFIALQGPNFDGHSYVADALEKGAAAAVVEKQPEALAEDAPLLQVDDTLAALWRLGAAARARSGARFIAVTGSVGKTGTKEALRHCLTAQAATSANVGSLNNHWGVPLSLARMPRRISYGVFELGMNNPGEILELARLVRPQVAVITNIEAAHIGNFESVEAIADAKSEVFQAMDPEGIAVLNRDHELFHHLSAKAAEAGVTKLLSFGHHQEADARALSSEQGATYSDVRARIAGQEIAYRIALPGAHWVLNSLAVLAAVKAAGGDVAAAAAALAGLTPLKGRGQRHRIAIPGGSFELIDDSYNANPTSMRAAFDVLSRAEPKGAGRRIAVLGDMLELGAHAVPFHRALDHALIGCGANLVFTCGPAMQELSQMLPPELVGGHSADSDALAPLVCGALGPGDVVLVKGSLGSRMKVIVDALLGLDEGLPPAANGS